MAKKLKAFVTSVGFFDLAIAAPSMKAALDAWGLKHNAFQQGFASQTSDAKIIAAATEQPGVVLRRPVGTQEPFREDAELPKNFTIPIIGSTKRAAPKPAPQPRTKKPPARKLNGRAERSAIISFEKAKAKRDRERAKKQAASDKQRAKRSAAVEKAQAALTGAREKYERTLDVLERERAKLDGRIEQEQKRWESRQQILEAAVDRARG